MSQSRTGLEGWGGREVLRILGLAEPAPRALVLPLALALAMAFALAVALSMVLALTTIFFLAS